jgi:hypothetical protein
MESIMGDNLVLELHMEQAVSHLKKAKNLLDADKYGEARHEITKALLEAEEMKMLYNKLNNKI